MAATVGVTLLILLIISSSNIVVAEVALDITGWQVVQLSFHVSVRYHIEGSMKLNARILHLAHMVYL